MSVSSLISPYATAWSTATNASSESESVILTTGSSAPASVRLAIASVTPSKPASTICAGVGLQEFSTVRVCSGDARVALVLESKLKVFFTLQAERLLGARLAALGEEHVVDGARLGRVVLGLGGVDDLDVVRRDILQADVLGAEVAAERRAVERCADGGRLVRVDVARDLGPSRRQRKETKRI